MNAKNVISVLVFVVTNVWILLNLPGGMVKNYEDGRTVYEGLDRAFVWTTFWLACSGLLKPSAKWVGTCAGVLIKDHGLKAIVAPVMMLLLFVLVNEPWTWQTDRQRHEYEIFVQGQWQARQIDNLRSQRDALAFQDKIK